MSDKTSKLIQWFLYLLMGISAVLGILFYTNAIKSDLLMYWGYLLLAVLILVTLAASLSNLFMHPKGAIKFAIILGGMVLIAIISYSVSTNTFTALQLEKMDITESTSKMVGAGLYITYVMFGAALLSIIYTAVSRIFK
jgi:uncharacterized membrane protein